MKTSVPILPLEPWKPHCALLPSGIALDMSGVHSDTVDEAAFCAMFGVEGSIPDKYARHILIDGYKRVAYTTTMQLSKFMK